MRGSAWLLALGCGLMLSASGCCGNMNGCGCGGNTCGDCGGECGPGYRRPLRQANCGEDCCGPTRNVCDSCGCDNCNGCCERNFCFHPLRWLGSAFWSNTYSGGCCGGGSGCDGGCGCSGGDGGYYDGGSTSQGSSGYTTGRPGCKNCNRGGSSYDGEMSAPADGEMVPGGATPQPTPAPPPKTSRRIYPSTQYN